VSGFFGVNNLKELNVEIEQVVDIYAEIAGYVKVSIHNKKTFFPSYLLDISIKDSHKKIAIIKAQEKFDFYLAITLDNRGHSYINYVTVSSIFPFNFFIRNKRFKKDKHIIVYPKPVKCEDFLNSIKNNKPINGQFHSIKDGYDQASHIREYIVGDMLKNMNWRYFAKNEKLITKKFDSVGSPPVILEISKTPDIEKVLSNATYIINKHLKSHIPVGLKTDNFFLKPGISHHHRHKLLTILALYDKD
jgi:uncharacterized protein (DUF58 family)